MSNQSLLGQIASLRSALSGKGSVDPAVREQLVQLRGQIEDIVEHHGERSVTDRLEALAVRFETDHPAAGTALRQAIDALAKAGI